MTRNFLTSVLLSSLLLFVGSACSDKESPTDEPKPDNNDNTSTKTEVLTKRYTDGLTFYSQKLEQQVTYSVYVPQEYLNDTSASFAVVYLFHGYGDSPDSWNADHFDIQTVDESARKAGIIEPVIYVMPDGYKSYYVNRYDGSFNYMDMFVDEFVPLIDKLLRTRPDAKHRAIAGYSMGGFGALTMVSKHPDMFGTCIALSPSLNTDAQYRTLGGWDSQWGSIFGGKGTTGDSRLTSYYKSMCPLHFFSSNPSQFSSVKYYIDCGDDEERLYAGNGELHSLMRDMGIKHEYRVRNGAHTTAYWREGLREGLAVFSAAINGTDYVSETAINVPTGDAPSEVSVNNAPCAVKLFTGAGYRANENSHVAYVEIGDSPAGITANDIVDVFASNLALKNMALAIVRSEDAGNTDADELFTAVESTLGITGVDSHRQFLVCGSNLKIFSPIATSGRQVASFYFYDSDFTPASGAKLKASRYGIDITDDGTNYKAALSTFCAIRDAGTTVEYRVHNGTDNSTCAHYGLYNLVSFMVSNVPIR
jgi:enterochelin esterase-like enzyme